MKNEKLIDRLKGINNLLNDIKNKKLQDVEFEIEHITGTLEIIIKDVDDFGVEEDYVEVADLKKSSSYKKVAEYILDSADSCNEVIWLLKKHYKDLSQLTETYSDALNEDLIVADNVFQCEEDVVAYFRAKGDKEYNKASNDYILQEAHEQGLYVVKDGNFIICDCGDGNGVSKEHCDCEEE